MLLTPGGKNVEPGGKSHACVLVVAWHSLPSEEVIKIIWLIKISNTKRNYFFLKGGTGIIKLIASQKELLLLRKKSGVCVCIGM